MPPELFANCRCQVAEGPRWNSVEKCLYWVDIPTGTVYRKSVNAAPEKFESFSPGIGKIGALNFYQNSLLLFGAGCRIWRCEFGGTPELFAKLPVHAATRFNDVLADRAGHFFCGVAWNPHPGELWKFTPETRRFESLDGNFNGMPNGMGISPDRRKFYFVVSEDHRIYVYDFDEKAGILRNRTLLVEFPPEEGNPDGMAVHPKTGELAVAFWDGGHFSVLDERGTLKKKICFPIDKVTSVEFSEQWIFVTTGNYPWRETEWTTNYAGSVFKLPLEK